MRHAFKGVVDAMHKAKDPERARQEHKARVAESAANVDQLRNDYNRISAELKAAKDKPETQDALNRKVASYEARAKSFKEQADELRARMKPGKPTRAQQLRESDIAGLEWNAKRALAQAEAIKSGGIQTDRDRADVERLTPQVEAARTEHNDAASAHNSLARMDPTLTAFARASQIKDGGSRKYWATPHEMFARAFESHVHNKLKKQGRENSYLVNGAKLGLEERAGLYPEGAEMDHIGESIDRLLDVLKKGGHLAKAIASLGRAPTMTKAATLLSTFRAVMHKATHTPPEPVRAAARRGLELRKKHGKGGLTTQEAGKQGIGSGVARARDLAGGKSLSTATLKRMSAFFSRHEKNKSGGEDDAGYIAWLLWGGDAGRAWVRRELAAVESEP